MCICVCVHACIRACVRMHACVCDEIGRGVDKTLMLAGRGKHDVTKSQFFSLVNQGFPTRMVYLKHDI